MRVLHRSQSTYLLKIGLHGLANLSVITLGASWLSIRAVGEPSTFKRTIIKEDNLCQMKYKKLSILPSIEDTFMFSFYISFIQ